MTKAYLVLCSVLYRVVMFGIWFVRTVSTTNIEARLLPGKNRPNICFWPLELVENIIQTWLRINSHPFIQDHIYYTYLYNVNILSDISQHWPLYYNHLVCEIHI